MGRERKTGGRANSHISTWSSWKAAVSPCRVLSWCKTGRLWSWPSCPQALADPTLCPPPAFLLWDPAKVPPRLQDVTDDHIRMHKLLQESGLKYVAVMPPHIGEWGWDIAAGSPLPVLCRHLPGFAWPVNNSKPSPHTFYPFSCLILFSFLTYFPVIPIAQTT